MKNEFAKIKKIIENYDSDKNKLIPILQKVQEIYKYLPENVLMYIAGSLSIPPAKVFGVATFYSHFALNPKGKYVIKVCDGTACHVKRSIPIVDALEKRLKIDEKNNTTEDLLFTLEKVSCLGACGLAPVVVINEEVHSLMTPEKTVEIVNEIYKQEAVNEKVAC